MTNFIMIVSRIVKLLHKIAEDLFMNISKMTSRNVSLEHKVGIKSYIDIVVTLKNTKIENKS